MTDLIISLLSTISQPCYIVVCAIFLRQPRASPAPPGDQVYAHRTELKYLSRPWHQAVYVLVIFPYDCWLRVTSNSTEKELKGQKSSFQWLGGSTFECLLTYANPGIASEPIVINADEVIIGPNKRKIEMLA
jgi:hypothetical protein